MFKILALLSLPIGTGQTVFNLQNTEFTLQDGSSTPNKFTLVLGEGTVSFDEKKAREYIKDRGKLYAVRNGVEEPMEVSFDILWTAIKGSTTTELTIIDVLKRTGGAAAWVSSDATSCNPFALNVVIDFDPECTGEVAEDITNIVLPDFRYESIQFDAKAGTIKVTGKCNAKEAIITRIPQTT